MPALIASLIIIINIIRKKEFPLFLTFWKVFKKEYIKAQKTFIILVCTGIIIFLSLYYYYSNMSLSTYYLIAFYFMLLITIIFIMTCLHVVPVYVHFPNLKPLKIIKNALIISIGFLFQSIILILVNVIFFILVYFFDFLMALVPFVLLSALIYLSYMIIANKYNRLSDIEVLNLDKYLE
jgi:uncharacterized membrane protein YesL